MFLGTLCVVSWQTNFPPGMDKVLSYCRVMDSPNTYVWNQHWGLAHLISFRSHVSDFVKSPPARMLDISSYRVAATAGGGARSSPALQKGPRR